ncbi:MAG: hypothetical protein MN733_23385 [Nitrososphaera sp.]|nr:hypothetical protein [Nitrososphaera sp.]
MKNNRVKQPTLRDVFPDFFKLWFKTHHRNDPDKGREIRQFMKEEIQSIKRAITPHGARS